MGGEAMKARRRDPRELPAYRIPEAAHYLRIPVTTLRAWVLGQDYDTAAGRHRHFAPVIRLPSQTPPRLSFINLVEAHVLDAIRRQHEVPLQKVRQALRYLRRIIPSSAYPLADQHLETDGFDLFIEHVGQLLVITREGQLAMKQVLGGYLQRIERDAEGIAARLYPFTRKRDLLEPRLIVIDPRIAFGRPVIAGSGIPTAVVAERYKAGESMDELADDYGRARLEIEEAIRCELVLDAAA
jgi:uncharacterized protein (DUF433 family)